MLAGLQVEPVEQQPDLARLRRLERLVGRDRLGEDRARIGHARVEPGGVEIVAEIVMVGDVAPRAARVVGAQRVGEPVDQPPRPLGPRRRRRGSSALRMNRSNSGTGSGLVHSPRAQALYQPTEPEVASRTSARQLLQVDDRDRPVAAAAEDAEAAVGQASRRSGPRRGRRRSGRARAWKPPANSRATRPPPVAKPRSAATRCLPRCAVTRGQ